MNRPPAMPRSARALLGALLLAMGLLACDGEPAAPPLPTLVVEPLVLDMAVGGVSHIAATVTGVADPVVSFLSSDNSVAVVDAQGQVTALRRGTATVTVSVAGHPELVAATLVQVTRGGDPADVRVVVSPAALIVAAGETVPLSARVEGITAQGVEWRSVDTTVAVVSAAGAVTGRRSGVAVIVASSAVVREAVGTATVTVTPAAPLTVTVSPAGASIPVGRTLQLTAAVAGTGDVRVGWRSLDTAVVQVSATGLVTARASGIAAVQAYSLAEPGATGTASITVGLVGVILEPPSGSLDVGDTLRLRASVSGVADTSVIWSSGNPAVATVEHGLVEALAPGLALITATSAGAPEASASVIVDVRAPPAGGLSVASIESVDPITGERTIRSPVDLSGLIEVTANVGAPADFLGTLRLLADGVTLAERAVTAGTDTAAFLVQTAAFDSVTGAPRFVNGPHTFGFWLVDLQDRVVAATSVPVGLSNPDGFAVRTRSLGASATDPAGAVWWRGDVVVSALPVIYSASQVIGRVRAALCRADDGAVLSSGVDATRADGFAVRFPAGTATGAAGGSAGLEAAVRGCIVDSETTGGAPGPTLVLNGAAARLGLPEPPPLRVDNRAPAINAPFTLAPGQATVWITPAFAFTRESTGLGGADAVVEGGVGGVVCTFGAGASYDALAPVVTGADLAESQTDSAYVARVTCADALGNASVRDLSDAQGGAQRFGVDYP
ncbi:MAG TPA: Ig-like domain-containing protein [Longimicrobiales bacterium]|nr:Ig-like domain-containing protein [Longimicrobiales bacterium]